MAVEENQSKETRLHPRNRNRERYDLDALVQTNPDLSHYVKPNKYGEDSVDFSNPMAVKILNKSLLQHYYGIPYWEFPDENLCPPIPGRADYLHHIADLLREHNFGSFPDGDKITCYDIGVGANCIYPIIGVTEYAWNFIGSDIDPISIAAAQQIVDSNPGLAEKVSLKLQENARDVLYGVIDRDEKVDLTICNPPFHSSTTEAQKGSRRKVKNLTGKVQRVPKLNFAGIQSELICDGGENRFIANMIKESRKFGANCFLYSTLVSKKTNLKGIYKALEKFEATIVRTIPMGTGNKSTRIVAWSFLTKQEQKEWKENRWNVKKESDTIEQDSADATALEREAIVSAEMEQVVVEKETLTLDEIASIQEQNNMDTDPIEPNKIDF